MNRRSFVAASFALASALKAAKPSVKFPADPRHRLAVATYPFRSFIGAEKVSLTQFAAGIVEKFNVYGIEPWSRHFESVEPEYVHGLSSEFKIAGLTVVNIPCDIHVKLCGTSGERAEALAAYQKWIDAAIILGSPSIRVHCPEGKTADDIACAVDGLKTLAAIGADKNIVINLENDDPRSEDPARVLRVIQAVNNPYLRSLPDFCNSMQIHNDEDYNARALASLFPVAYNISHVKDVEIVNGKALRVDVNRIFQIANKAHYGGYFSMETEGSTDPYAGTRQLIAAAVKNLTA